MNIKTLFLSLVLVGLSSATLAQTQQQRLEKHVYYFASDSLQGRKAGTADANKAANYIEREFKQMGLTPFFTDFNQYFYLNNMLGKDPAVTVASPDDVPANSNLYRNVVAIFVGNDPQLKKEVIVIGGHYDHLGVKNGQVYNGADDNASGAASVIEIARQLNDHRGELQRSVIVCAFDAEEMGLFGSKAFASQLNRMGLIDHVKMMMSIDMVGWLKQGKSLSMTGTATLEDGKQILDAVADQVGIRISTHALESNPLGATDTEPFGKLNCPTLHVTTGLKSPYHKPADDADLIDYPGLSQVTDYLAALTLRMASAEQSMIPTGMISMKHGGKGKLLEVAPLIGYNASSFVIPSSIYTLDSKIGFRGGISTMWNITKRLGIEVDAIYDYARMPYPDENDVFGPGLVYRQQSVTVPAQLKLKTSYSGVGLNLGVGGYYGYRFNGHLTQSDGTETTFDNHHEYGIAWSIEERTSNLSLGFTFYHPLSVLFPQQPGSIVPAGKRKVASFTIGWYF